MALGRVIRFDEIRGYGFIAPSAGGEDVFVHANDFGDQRHQVHPGMRVEYEVEQGERGLKVASLQVLEADDDGDGDGSRRAGKATASRDDNDMCDVLTSRQFGTEIVEILIQKVPTLTGGQIVKIRQHLTEHALSHNWIDR